eukprot:s890_g13.t1
MKKTCKKDSPGTVAPRRKRHREEATNEAEPEVLQELLNAPSLQSGLSLVSRPPKRRRLRAPLRLPEAWQSSVKEIFRAREAPQPSQSRRASG